MGRKKLPATTKTRIRIKDLKKLQTLAKQSNLSLPAYLARLTKQLK